MAANFDFLQKIINYKLFAPAALEAEKVYATSPAMCVIGCRKALELAVKWVYAADNTIDEPYQKNLQSLIHESTFIKVVNADTWKKLPIIIKLGNLAVHTERNISAGDALFALHGLFEFIEWLDYYYGADYQVRHFNDDLIPKAKVIIDTKKIKAQESLLTEKE